ncbi:2-phospho-L-lactate transferase [Marinobacterium arenosum]|uniref:2-phospho-L-lactate transferase n=1 Tax=Marinobacterium arenosum TaxID=2862496 RepID=UPI001C98692C|nr:2-phospho-L-lactate transferase [Marinobacterium arenosum]MBY4677013.1 2-phospho-L-lactate transferase [Marinobacterium arenosum]
MSRCPKITLLAGGVGGAKAAEGLASSHYRWNLQIIGNVADDQEFHGLWVSPDIDTLTYSLADLIDRQHGWGLRGDSSNTLHCLERLGAETWMQLGDMDFATHIFRTEQRRLGRRPTEIATQIAKRLGVEIPLLLPTDDRVQTRIGTDRGWLSFQEYFVRERCAPQVLEVRFDGIEQARPTAEALAAIRDAELILIAPSNPIVSIGPILATPGIRDAISRSDAYCIAISPLIGGKTVKGPADRMMSSLGYQSDLLGIAELYHGLIDALVIDRQDQPHQAALESLGLAVSVTDTLMSQPQQKQALMEHCVEFALAQQDRSAA